MCIGYCPQAFKLSDRASVVKGGLRELMRGPFIARLEFLGAGYPECRGSSTLPRHPPMANR